MARRFAHVHNEVYATAVELCLAEYEVLMGNNELRAAWKAKHPGAGEKGLQRSFLNRYVRAFVGPARATLTIMLSTSTDEDLKERLHRALVLDNTLTRGRDASQNVDNNSQLLEAP